MNWNMINREIIFCNIWRELLLAYINHRKFLENYLKCGKQKLKLNFVSSYEIATTMRRNNSVSEVKVKSHSFHDLDTTYIYTVCFYFQLS